MELDLRTLTISRTELFVHPIPLRPEAQRCATLATTVQEDAWSRIQSNLRISLQKQQQRLVFSDGSAVKPLIDKIIHAKDGDFCEVSQQLAQLLYKQQPGNSSQGMLIVTKAQCNGFDALALLKVDREIRVKDDERETDSGFAIDLSMIPTLGLEGQRVVKAALFVASADGDGITEIVASDHQADGKDGGGIADFFLLKFLGCSRKESDTNRFSSVVSAGIEISNKLEDPHERLNLLTQITSLKESDVSKVNVDDLVTSYVPQSAQTIARKILAEHKIDATEILKDEKDAEDKHKYISYDLSNGLRIIGPVETIHKLLDTKTVDGTSTITIEAEIVHSGLRQRK